MNLFAILAISQFADAMRRETKGKGMLGEKEARKKSTKKMRGKVLREIFEELAKNKTFHQIHEETGYSLKIICKLAKEFKEDEDWYRMFYPESGDPTTEHWEDYEKHPYEARIVPKGTGKPAKNEMPESFKRHQRVLERAWKERRTVKLITGKEEEIPLSFKTEQRLLKKAWKEGKPLGKIRKRERERAMKEKKKKKKKKRHKESVSMKKEQRILKKAWERKRTIKAIMRKEK